MPTPSWTQTPKEIHVTLAVPAGTRGKDVQWRLTSKEVELRTTTQPAGEPALLGSAFFYPVRADDSTWELEGAPGGGRSTLRQRGHCTQPSGSCCCARKRASTDSLEAMSSSRLGCHLDGLVLDSVRWNMRSLGQIHNGRRDIGHLRKR
jgi:hypothetical protein